MRQRDASPGNLTPLQDLPLDGEKDDAGNVVIKVARSASAALVLTSGVVVAEVSAGGAAGGMSDGYCVENAAVPGMGSRQAKVSTAPYVPPQCIQNLVHRACSRW